MLKGCVIISVNPLCSDNIAYVETNLDKLSSNIIEGRLFYEVVNSRFNNDNNFVLLVYIFNFKLNFHVV